MSEVTKTIRLSKVARELNVGISTIKDFLSKKGIEVEPNPNTKIDEKAYNVLIEEFQSEKTAKEESRLVGLNKVKRESVSIDDKEQREAKGKAEQEDIFIKNLENVAPDKQKDVKSKEQESKEEETKEEESKEADKEVKVVGKIDLDSMNQKTRPDKKSKKKEEEEKKTPADQEKDKAVSEEKEEKPAKKEEEKEEELTSAPNKLEGPTVVGKIDLPSRPIKKKPVASSSDEIETEKPKKKKRKRIRKEKSDQIAEKTEEGGKSTKGKKKKYQKQEVSQEEVSSQIKETMARLSGGGKSKGSKYRKARREAGRVTTEEDRLRAEEEQKVLKVTEYVTVSELANMIDANVNDIISACMSLGLFVSINQRLDAETLSIVAEEFGYQVDFVSAESQENVVVEDDDDPASLVDRPPIVTVMGHVDHGKTSLLDHVRKANVIAGEAGGITQHIGAYSVELDDGRKITFLDTPGHEAFTAMRARGAQVTDVAIIVIAADDNVMPQTKEAINHAQAAGVPMVFAINKVDKPGANPEKIKEELAAMNLLVEDWGGKFQSQDISAKQGDHVDELLDKVLLEAELLELKANPERRASGTIIEAALDKGRGYVTTVLVQNGTLKKGNILLAGCHAGRVKAMFNERGQEITEAGPSIPASVLGLSGAPNAGDRFVVMEDEKETRNIANKRLQLQREQGIRAHKHITLDEIGRRLAIGDFRELNVIVKGDVDGSVEALADSLLKLSTEKIVVNVIHKSVGQITESDVLLASASDAIIIGFQVRPSPSSRKLAEKEQIDIRLYSVIYDAIAEITAAMEGMLAPKVEEKIVGNLEVRDVFKISKVGTVAGCYVLDGKLHRNTRVRIIREGIVVYDGELGSLKRFKEDVKEVAVGYECGLNIKNFNDIKVGDIIEGYEEVEVKQKL